MASNFKATTGSAPPHVQTPIAVIGMSCRLPGGCNSPEKFWKFLLDGGIADTTPLSSRFSFAGHYDGTLRPWTMRSPGGMFIDIDPRDIDAGFFGLSQVDAVAMDPLQRQLLEVVYEGLENSGLTLEGIKSKPFGCFVGSYASDYSDIQTRDPEDKSPSFTVGCGRAMMSNRISHFLDIKGPSMTIDTACSGSLIAVDLACRYLDSGDADGAIVAGCNLYMSPEHNMDQHAMTAAASPSGRCWTFDARADGYIKAEAVNCLILKRLDDAIRDGDPIRAVIRGTSTNSDGWTAGIASPSAKAQALAIQRAYQRPGISCLSDTPYLECHGTGTLAGDPVECKAAASVFRSQSPTLRIGSVKSNIGHSEPAAGISGMIKSVLCVERAMIPGNPTFEIPNPKIDFEGYGLAVSNTAVSWPAGAFQRARVNSFGYGGSNAHAIVEHPSILLGHEYTESSVTSLHQSDQLGFMNPMDLENGNISNKQKVFVFSANDQVSLKASVGEYIRHLSNPAVKVDADDLAYTLAKRRTHHFHRAYAVSDSPRFKESQVVYGKVQAVSSTFTSSAPIGFVFTGQGAQRPQMGRELLSDFPEARKTVQHLDQVLQSLSDVDKPTWSLEEELSAPRSAEHMRQPEYSQPLVTALQLALLAVVRDWGVTCSMAVGHSSGEIAAAVAAGLLTPEEGIKVAYLRGKATADVRSQQQAAGNQKAEKLGMLAVGLGPEKAGAYIDAFPRVKIACYNSPQSVTLSGPVSCLESIQNAVKADNGFARLLVVDLAYHHSGYMKDIAEQYRKLLATYCPNSGKARHDIGTSTEFFSSVDGCRLRGDQTYLGIEYWANNLLCPVKFSQAMSAMITHQAESSKSNLMLLELGPSGALAGPINQVRQSLPLDSLLVQYFATLNRSRINSTLPLYELAGKIFLMGATGVDWFKVNRNREPGQEHKPRIITDLPNYQWNHSIKYWHESLASHDWRYRPFPVHDLLGSKVLETSWETPTWKRTLRLKDVPWVRDHTTGTNVVFPASAYIAMAVEAMFQTTKGSSSLLGQAQHQQSGSIDHVTQLSYQLRDVRLLQALVLKEDQPHQVYLSLTPDHGRQKDTWFHFRISSLEDKTNKTWTEHCTGHVRLHAVPANPPSQSQIHSLEYPTTAKLWYKSLQNVGFNFGPSFQTLSEIECIAGQRTSRAKINCAPSPAPASGTHGSSQYPVHPCVLDGFFQACTPSLYQGHRTMIEKTLVPKIINEIVIYSSSSSFTPPRRDNHTMTKPNSGETDMLNLLAETDSTFSVAGRKDKVQNYASNVTIYDLNKGGCPVATIKGLHYTELPLPASEVTLSGQDPQKTPTLMKVLSRLDIALLYPEVDLGALTSHSLQEDSELRSEVNGLSERFKLPLEAGYLISLLRHKIATPSVLDMDITTAKTVSASGRGIRPGSGSTGEEEEKQGPPGNFRAGFNRYLLTYSDPSLLSAGTAQYYHQGSDSLHDQKERIQERDGVEFGLYNPVAGGLPGADGDGSSSAGPVEFDLLVLRADIDGPTDRVIDDGLPAALQAAREACAKSGFLLLLLQAADQHSSHTIDSQLALAGLGTRVALMTSSNLCIRLCAPLDAQPNSNYSIQEDLGVSSTPGRREGVEIRVLDHSTMDISSGTFTKSAESPFRDLHTLDSKGSPLRSLQQATAFLEPIVTRSPDQNGPINPDRVLVLLDNPRQPLLLGKYGDTSPESSSGWTELKNLLLSSRGWAHIIWVLFGSDSVNPSNGLVRGLTRSVRNENPDLTIILLTLEDCHDETTSAANVPEREYVERSFRNGNDGQKIVYIDRIKPLQQTISSESYPALQETPLRQNPNTIRLHCERVGPGTGMNSLYFNETTPSKSTSRLYGTDLQPGQVEVSLHAAGLNFKDIATTLGLVAENEHLLGLEGAGIITKLPPVPAPASSSQPSSTPTYKLGDRVAVLSRGCFANRITVPIENIFAIPKNISFEEVATMPIVYFTAIYSLIEIAHLPDLIIQRKKKNLPPISILIHSAAGGVGLATIQLCRHLGINEIYATVGSDSKKIFLAENHGIPPERIFSSRTPGCSAGVRAIRGEGVDVVLNSLTGDLLDESWRLLADGGIFLEIGKRDIVDGNVLDMGPFNRGCSYHGIDISRPGVYDDLELNFRVLQMARELLAEKRIEPIRPVKAFSFGKIPDAMRYMRSGEHMGKIVISDGAAEDVKVLFRGLREEKMGLGLNPDAAYLIVGGLKGLCGSLAVFMARCGAKNLVAMSRSGGRDDVSRRVIRDLESLGVDVTIVTANVTDLEETKAVFQQSRRPIKGIIHGAMVLRDKTFESMTEQEFHEALAPKYAGTWNLHLAADETNNGPLDFFTMLSSISGVIGTAGQANYAAGNSFQDAFAKYRRSLGLAAQAVDLGAVDDVGYLSDNQSISDRLRSRSQITSLSESQLHQILRASISMQLHTLRNEAPTQLVTGLSYPLEDNTSPLLSDPRFHSLLVPEHQRLQHPRSQGSSPHAGKQDRQGHRASLFRTMIKDAKVLASPTKRDSLVNEAVKLVNEQLVRILGLSADMEGSKPLRSYGIDSLAAVDLRNWLKVRLGAELSTLDILNGGSLDDLGVKIVDEMLKKEGGEGE